MTDDVLDLARDWNPALHPKDASGRWAAAQAFAEAANAELDRKEADARRAGRRMAMRARQEYGFIRNRKPDGDDPDADGRTADAHEAIVRAVSDTLPGPMHEHLAGDPADAIKEHFVEHGHADPVPDEVWESGAHDYRADQAHEAVAAGVASVPAKYHPFLSKYEMRAVSHIQEHGRVDAKKVFKQPDEHGLDFSRSADEHDAIDLARHSYSSTHVNLGPDLTPHVLKLAHEIDDADLDEKGREIEPHITVKYGLHTQEPEKVAAVLNPSRGKPTIGPRFKLGKLSLFEANETRPSDVLKIDVDSPDLHHLNGLLSDNLEHTTTFPVYKPHVTLAYLKPGKGKKYVQKLNKLEGRSGSAGCIRFSDQDGMVTDLAMPDPVCMSRSILPCYDPVNRVWFSRSEDGEPGQWITEKGVHIHLDEKGHVDKGPAHMVGKHIDEVRGGDKSKEKPAAATPAPDDQEKGGDDGKASAREAAENLNFEGEYLSSKDANAANSDLEHEGGDHRVVPSADGKSFETRPASEIEDEHGDNWELRRNWATGGWEAGDRTAHDEREAEHAEDPDKIAESFNGRTPHPEEVEGINEQLANADADVRVVPGNDGKWEARTLESIYDDFGDKPAIWRTAGGKYEGGDLDYAKDDKANKVVMHLSRSASTGRPAYDPANRLWLRRGGESGKPFPGASGNTGVGSHGDHGHFVTIEHHVVFILDSSGHVPARLEVGGAKRFTRKHVEDTLVAHHKAMGGTWGPEHDHELAETNAGGDPWTFKGSVPTDVKEAAAQYDIPKGFFRVTQNHGGGADAFGALGDRYLQLAALASGSSVRLAKEHARNSGDTEMEFLAKLHDNLPKRSEGAAPLEKLNKEGLRIGDKFTIGGDAYRVAEDESGMRVLTHGKDFSIPVSHLSDVPHDKGSFRPGSVKKKAYADDIPFSRVVFDPHERVWMSRGEPETVNRPVYDHAARRWDFSRTLFDPTGTSRAGASGAQRRMWDPSDHPRDEIGQFADKANAAAAAGKPKYDTQKKEWSSTAPATNSKGEPLSPFVASLKQSQPASAIKPNLFGQPVIDSSGIGKQQGMFHEPNAAPAIAKEKPLGSRNANDPKNTAPMFQEGAAAATNPVGPPGPSFPSDNSKERFGSKPFLVADATADNAIVNVPLHKRGDIDAQIDRHKREQAAQAKAKAKADAQTRRGDKDVARELFERHGKAIAESTAAKHGVPVDGALKQLDSMVKWDPTRARQLMEQFVEKQGATAIQSPADFHRAEADRHAALADDARRRNDWAAAAESSTLAFHHRRQAANLAGGLPTAPIAKPNEWEDEPATGPTPPPLFNVPAKETAEERAARIRSGVGQTTRTDAPPANPVVPHGMAPGESQRDAVKRLTKDVQKQNPGMGYSAAHAQAVKQHARNVQGQAPAPDPDHGGLPGTKLSLYQDKITGAKRVYLDHPHMRFGGHEVARAYIHAGEGGKLEVRQHGASAPDREVQQVAAPLLEKHKDIDSLAKHATPGRTAQRYAEGTQKYERQSGESEEHALARIATGIAKENPSWHPTKVKQEASRRYWTAWMRSSHEGAQKRNEDLPFSRAISEDAAGIFLSRDDGESCFLSPSVAEVAIELPLGLSRYATHKEYVVGGATKRVPLSYWKKNALRCGRYEHPTQRHKEGPLAGQHIRFDVTPKELDQWVDKFKQMSAAGVKVPVTVDHREGARDVLGYVLDMRRNGETLEVTQCLEGEDAAALASKNYSSVSIQQNWKDEYGRNWGAVIAHNTLTPIPVMGGLGEFEPVSLPN